MTSLDNVVEDVSRITEACELPMLVDVDTGWGGAFNIARTTKAMIKSGAAAMHMEDQVSQKRCGHRPNKAIVSTSEMVDRIKAAVDARYDDSFVIMARTDALAVEGLDSAIERSSAFIEAGADMIFAEAVTELEQYQSFVSSLGVPILANITEFGSTPLFALKELRQVGVSLALYPLSAFRAMNKAAENTYRTILEVGHARELVDSMQTRSELYEYLNYHEFERKLDDLFKAD
jgi:methylisocitrate lyase